MTKRIFWKRWGCTALVIVALWGAWARGAEEGGAGGGAGSAPQGPPPALVRLAEAREEELQDRFEVVGRLRELRRAVVAAEQGGRIVEYRVNEGEVVEGGKTVLARIDDVWAAMDLRTAEADLERAHATVAERRSALEQARRDLGTLETLLASNSAKPKEVEDARTTVQANTARLASASADELAAAARVALVKERLQRLSVLAPFDGTVVKKMTEVGQWVQPGDAVAEIVSRGALDAFIDVPERIINAVSVGEPVEVLVEPLNMEVIGQVVSVTPLASSAARTFPVKVRLSNEDGKLLPGMSVLGRVPTTQKAKLITVPRDAIARMPSGPAVWANLGGVGMPLPVRVLFGYGDRYAVQPLPGATGVQLGAGMQVVIEGAERLFPGQPLVAVPAGGAAAGAPAAPAGDTHATTGAAGE